MVSIRRVESKLILLLPLLGSLLPINPSIIFIRSSVDPPFFWLDWSMDSIASNELAVLSVVVLDFSS